MRYLKVSQLTVGEKYYFVDTDFHYGIIKKPKISKETIYRIVGGDFSTREDGDRYETIRHMAFPTKESAIKQAIKEVREYRKNINEDIDEIVKSLTTPSTK